LNFAGSFASGVISAHDDSRRSAQPFAHELGSVLEIVVLSTGIEQQYVDLRVRLAEIRRRQEVELQLGSGLRVARDERRVQGATKGGVSGRSAHGFSIGSGRSRRSAGRSIPDVRRGNNNGWSTREDGDLDRNLRAIARPLRETR
jgi:hypothetical protein